MKVPLRLGVASCLLLILILLPLSPAAAVHGRSAEQNTYLRHVRIGMKQMKNGDYRAAQNSFEDALRYNDNGADAHLGLGIVYYLRREDRQAELELKRAAELNPGDPAAYQLLGELSYRSDDLDEAVSYWEKAVKRDPGDSTLRARLERLRRERKTEKDFNRDVTSHFLIKYEGREKIEAGRIVLRILEDAYGDVGRELSYYPDREIQVILYSDRQFQEVTDAPGWSGGLYDGKIRLPIGGIEEETPGLRRLLYHEYTHAVVRAITPRCPSWLNEGLAQYFEGRNISAGQREVLKRISAAKALPSLRNLSGSFMGLGGNQAALAYLISLSSVRYMIDDFGMYRVRAVLDELGSGADLNKAISDGTMLSFEEFQRGWKRSLE